MINKMNFEHSLRGRLRPLYLASFFHGFVVWYAIEKLFIKTIGYNDASIGIMIALYSAIMILAETPSGILADRWSRKGVLILASSALAISGLIGAISNNVPTYLIAASFWGVFFAMYSGTYESIVYDTLKEEGIDSSRFANYYGKVQAVHSLALVTGSILGGFIGYFWGLRAAYWLTAPVAIFSVTALLKFREPNLHKAKVAVPIIKHIHKTFAVVLSNGQLVPITLVLITLATIRYTVYEFSQLWPVALVVHIIALGFINASVNSSIGIGGVAAGRLSLHRFPVMMGTVSAMLITTLGLVFTRNAFINAACLTLLGVCTTGLNIVFANVLHDFLGSDIRAGAASSVNTLGRMIIIPMSLIFGYTSNKFSIFKASWLMVGLATVVLIFVLKIYSQNKKLPSARAKPIL